MTYCNTKEKTTDIGDIFYSNIYYYILQFNE